MPRASAAKTALPAAARRALEALGRDVATARRRRKLPQQLLAERMLVSRQTVQRLEAGDPTVALGVFASALFVLGLIGRLETLLAPETDQVAMTADLARLPKHAHPRARSDLDF